MSGSMKQFRLSPVPGVRIFAFAVFIVCVFGGAAYAASISTLKENLEDNLNSVEEEIRKINSDLGTLKQEQKTLAREIKIIDANLRKIELEIRRTELSINKSEKAIADKEEEIRKVAEQLEESRVRLADAVRTLDQSDDQNMVELVLGSESFSDVFGKITQLENLQRSLSDQTAQIREQKEELDRQKEELVAKQDELETLRNLAVIQRADLVEQSQAKTVLLVETKGRERLFAEKLEKARLDAATIRQQMFELEGTGVSMTFEEAYQLIKKAAANGNVRPAFLMALLKKESRWGASVGTGNWRDDMHPRDWSAFFQICQELGLNPDTTPVSRKPSYGWGGAMGPAQFLPRTWLAWRDKVSAVTGHNPPSPWSLDDAFSASALKLAGAGASQQTPDAEWKAAMIYFAGSNWQNPAFSFYADGIMALASVYQEQIDILESGAGTSN